MKTFCKELKKAREKAGYSQAHVAEVLEYASAQFVSNWERSLSIPPLETLVFLQSFYRANTKKMYLDYQKRRINRLWK